jgi:hypothetical protein
MDIVVWLRSLGLGQYETAFRENEITEKVLPITFLRASEGDNSHNFGSPEAATMSNKSFTFVQSCIANSRANLAFGFSALKIHTALEYQQQVTMFRLFRYAPNSPSNAFASFRSRVSKPSVNHP